jgi:hypothetical protein
MLILLNINLIKLCNVWLDKNLVIHKVKRTGGSTCCTPYQPPRVLLGLFQRPRWPSKCKQAGDGWKDGLTDHCIEVHYIAVSNSWLREKNSFESAAGNWSGIWSLPVFGEWKSFFISDDMRFLWVLDLQDTKGLEDDHLHQIIKLFHVKYLSLRRCGRLLRLPNTLGNLRHLETLDVRDTQVIKLSCITIIIFGLMRYWLAFLKNEARCVHVDYKGTSLHYWCEITKIFFTPIATHGQLPSTTWIRKYLSEKWM